MKQIKTPEDIKQLGTILSIWAHPDDESFTAAGIMSTAVLNGQKVVCVTATKGEAGVQDETRWPARQLGDIRAKELQRALSILGINHHHWLDYSDGFCNKVSLDEAVGKLKDLIGKYKPDTILTFGPDGLTGHSDHQTVSRWASEAAKNTNINIYHAVEEEQRYDKYMIEADQKFDIYFNIDKPPVKKAAECDIAFQLPEAVLSKKVAALKAMPSQTEAMLKNTLPETINAMLSREFFVLMDTAN